MSKVTESGLAESLKRKLFPGIKDAQDATNKIEATQTFKTIELIITTRQMGFGTVHILMALRQFNNVPAIGNVYQMYRTFLAVYEAKTIVVNRGVTNLKLHSSDYSEPAPNEDFIITTKSLLNIPEPISCVINSIGIVSTNDRKYIPGIGKDNITARGERFIPQSEQVTYSNLRQVVTALADVNTPAEYRRRFYRNNPIPGTIWVGAPENPILVNADEIIPANYNLQTLRDDIDDVKVKMNYLVRKAPKYFGDPVKYESEGSKSMLTGNEQGGMRIKDRNAGELLVDHEARIRQDGDIQSYWNLERLSASEMINGAICLLGEIPATAALEYPIYMMRNERAANIL